MNVAIMLCFALHGMVQVASERKDRGKFTCPDRRGHTMNMGDTQGIKINRTKVLGF